MLSSGGDSILTGVPTMPKMPGPLPDTAPSPLHQRALYVFLSADRDFFRRFWFACPGTGREGRRTVGPNFPDQAGVVYACAGERRCIADDSLRAAAIAGWGSDRAKHVARDANE